MSQPTREAMDAWYAAAEETIADVALLLEAQKEAAQAASSSSS